MGQGASSGGAGGAGSRAAAHSAPAKTCYYELLAVSRTATQDEIKKAYRRKALELHPDRNYNDVERATKLFAEVQTAYEVLSDEQERAWYDSHRDAILRGHAPGSGGDEAQAAPIGVTTTEDVMGWFSHFSVRMSFADDGAPGEFYTTVRAAFETLYAEEVAAAEWEGVDVPQRYPGFGGARDTYKEGRVREFYAAWAQFRTLKSFAWRDVYRLSDAPDRRVKRMMEKENAKAREAARREYNEAVEQFVKFVRKRDPRYTPNSQSEAQRLEEVRKMSQLQAERMRRENAERRANYKAAAWTRVDEASVEEVGAETDEEGDGEGEGETGDEEEEQEEVTFECIVCRKKFGSQGQMNAHEQSKKHAKAVWQLKKQMLKENREFDLDRDVRGRETVLMEDSEEELGSGEEGEGEAEGEEGDAVREIEEALRKAELEKTYKTEEVVDDGDDDEDVPSSADEQPVSNPADSTAAAPPSDPTATDPTSDPASDATDNSDSDHIPTSAFTARVLGDLTPSSPTSSTTPSTTTTTTATPTTSTTTTTTKPAPKLGAAKAKRLKKSQAAASAAGDKGATHELQCSGCAMEFGSKTKLFAHLQKNPGHARLVGGGAGGGGGGKGKKGKR
ncbi:hypothetical protein EDC01DRAFT_785661 [Geopyxis carbonaria]|nr:hypothetical protein EDC01DRAFT_785661 [Geopyxis carbonaria]